MKRAESKMFSHRERKERKEKTLGSLCSLRSLRLSAFLIGGLTGLTGLGLSNNSTTFVGNWVYGGGLGEHGSGQSGLDCSYTLNYSGNFLSLFLPLDVPGDGPSCGVDIGNCTAFSVCGNTLAQGSYGLYYEVNCTNALIMADDFSGAARGGIGAASSSLPNAQVYRNIFNQGITFHAQIQPYTAEGWFFGQNQYRNGTKNVPIFLDPIAAPAHVSQ